MDPHDVLGLTAGASPEDISARYKELAKRWHPDVAGSKGAHQMATINAAYDLLRSGAWQDRKRTVPRERRPATARAPRVGDWLDAATRRALGPELLGALHPGEEVSLVTPTSVAASPQALLAVTDRRLLWLLDDAVAGRVRSLDHVTITGVETRLAWPRKRTATLKVSRRNGRRAIAFSDLRPETADVIAGLLRAKVRAA